jgi:uncharacterized protein (DUF362 family)
MKKLKNTKLKVVKIMAIGLIVVLIQAWDMTYNNIETVIDGSFRVDSLFKTPRAKAQKVAVIASDNALLTNPVAVSSSTLTYPQIKNMVLQAINLVGGIGQYVHAGDTVLIKPNIVGAKLTGDGENTDIRVVKSIISIIYDTYGNACKIYIGEGSARSNATMGGPGWVNAGYSVLSTDADMKGINFELVDLNDEVAGGVNLVQVPAKNNLAEPQKGKYWIHKYLISPNIKYIDVPVLKMHEPGLTCVLKNQIGIAAGAKYGWNKGSGGPGGKLIHHAQYAATYNYKTWQDEEIVDLCSCLNHFTLCVVDALMCLETQKTLIAGGGNQVRLNTIIAGADPVAVDHVCARIIGANPDDIAHITMAEKIGLGTNDADSIEIIGENISTKYKHQFIRGTIYSAYGQGNRVWLISPAYTYTNMTTDYLGGESTVNPSKGDKPWSAPIYFFDDRIDLNSYLNPSGNVVTYCFTQIYSPTAHNNAELWLNSEEDLTVFLNGQKVYTYSGTRPNPNFVTDKPLINLQAGENRLLVKVLQRTGCYDFSLNICEPETNGNRVDGLKFYIKGYNEPAAIRTGLSKPGNCTSTLRWRMTENRLEITNAEVSEIRLLNLKGQTLRSATGNKLELNDIPTGVYLIRAKLTNGVMVNWKIGV